MSKSVWTNEDKLAGQTSNVIVNDLVVTVDSTTITINGLIPTTWTNEPLN